MTGLSSDQRESLQRLVKHHHLDSCGAMLEELAQSAIQFVPSKPDNYSSTGVSRLGGVPDLPPEIEWPTIEGKYYVFAAQINLGEIPPIENNPLPAHGILYFFYGTLEEAVDIPHKVFYFDGDMGTLRAAAQPDTNLLLVDPKWSTHLPFRVEMKPSVSTPYFQSDSYFDIRSASDHPTSSYGKFTDRYFALQNDLKAFHARMETELSQLLGYSGSSGNPGHDAEVIYGRDPVPEETKKWRLLIEIGSHRKTQMCWWDAGFLQHFVHENDLAKHDFSRTYAAIETS